MPGIGHISYFLYNQIKVFFEFLFSVLRNSYEIMRNRFKGNHHVLRQNGNVILPNPILKKEVSKIKYLKSPMHLIGPSGFNCLFNP